MLCLWPFRHVSIDQRGRMRPCCSWRFEEYEEHYDDSTIVNFNHSTIQDYIDSQFLNTLQTDMANDQFPKGGCSDCINEMKSGRDTLFEAGNRKYAMSQNFRIHDMEIKFGNKCNLACIMCDVGSSSLHVKEKQNNPVPQELQQWIPAQGKDNTFDKQNLEELLAQAPNLMRLKFTGGEPTLLDGFKEFIERLSQTEHAKHIDVMIVTNGTTDVTKWIDTFSKFRLFEINWSTDGVGSAFEYIRWPGKWEKTREIQTKFNRIVKEKGYTNIVSILTSAIQLLNLDQLPSLLDYCKDAKFDWFSPVLVMWPEPLQLGIAPKHIKQNVIDKCKPYIDNKMFSEVNSFIKLIETSESHLTWNDTKKFLTYYDGVRNMSAKDMCPIYNEIENTLQGVAPL